MLCHDGQSRSDEDTTPRSKRLVLSFSCRHIRNNRALARNTGADWGYLASIGNGLLADG